MQRQLVDPRLAGYTLEPLAGGWSGETFLAVPDGSPGAGERLVVRYFADARHAAGAAGIQAALLARVRDVLPVPAVHEVHEGDAILPGLLITELVAGDRGDLVLARLTAGGPESRRPADALWTMGRALGRIAGVLAAVPMPGTGMFADAALRIEPFHLWLPDWVDTHAPRLEGTGWAGSDIGALRAVAERAARELDGAPARLVHSDLNPKNVLVDPVTLEVTAVLDWEFAHAGHPATDLGNLLRFDREPAYVEGVLDGYLAATAGVAQGEGAAQGEPGRRRATDLARAADLVALVDLAARRATNPVVRRAREHLLAIARTGDLHAAP
ncbi:aminoglycoside phosphotransferase (APT) family kinase protein [Promicromonospora sp. AC04]|uniref:phosphotransferase family protein n=1 Tax=Promicromonospora sp. AC04 TaxID=2135723 RepID=UPI000D3AC752|nr:phosphotransferase [Promicromonospora sp. AC04]PUB25418.1 aminoglycoside phosphotransferase (APT) family kinase protein [Promicromonospora sp. AC04]